MSLRSADFASASRKPVNGMRYAESPTPASPQDHSFFVELTLVKETMFSLPQNGDI